MLWLAVGNIVREQAGKLQTDATPQFLGGLSEVVWTQIGILSRCNIISSHTNTKLTCRTETASQDLEMFAKWVIRYFPDIMFRMDGDWTL